MHARPTPYVVFSPPLQSRHSWHSLPQGRGSKLLEDSFDHTPGSRIPQLHYASDYEASLSQESWDGGRGSLSQGSLGMRNRSTENLRPHRPVHHHPHDQFARPFDFNDHGGPPMIGGYLPYEDPRGQRSSLPYHPDHLASRPLRPSKSRDEFSPSPGPPLLDPRGPGGPGMGLVGPGMGPGGHGMGPGGPGMGPGGPGMGPGGPGMGPGGPGMGPGGPGMGPGGPGMGPGGPGMGPPGQFWHSYNNFGPRPGPNMGPMPPLGAYQPGPPHISESRYRYRSNTPDGPVPLHGMSPAPSPHPTPPTTPPPPNSGHLSQGPPPPPQPMMHHQQGLRMPLPPPGMGLGHGPPHPMMGPPPPPPWEHGFDSYSMGPPPPPHGLLPRPHPPMQMGHGPPVHGPPPMLGRFPPEYHDRDWKHH